MALDSVKPLCLESPQGGGTQLDIGPTEVDPTQDALAAAGMYVSGPSVQAPDKAVLLDRVGNSLRLTDQVTSHVLGELVSSTNGQVGSHQALVDIIHFLTDGPGDGWPSGAVCQEAYNGLLLARQTWYTTSAMTTPIVQRAFTYSGLLVLTETLTLYGPTGQPARIITDTYAYTGILRTGRTRTWS